MEDSDYIQTYKDLRDIYDDEGGAVKEKHQPRV